MHTIIRRLLTATMLLAGMAWAAADGPAVTWIDAAAERPVDHGVMIRSPFAESHEKVTVQGPVALVAIGTAADTGPIHVVYRVRADDADRPAAVRIDGVDPPLHLGPVEFLVVPARRLAADAAGDAARGVYEARPILDDLDNGQATRGPSHLCLPVGYRHHFERVEALEPHRGFLLAPAPEADDAAEVHVVDDFGLNRLRVGSGRRTGTWVEVQTIPHAP